MTHELPIRARPARIAPRRGPVRLATGLLAALLALGALAAPTPASAQTQSSPALVLTGQDAWSPAGGVFTLRLRTEGVPSSAGLDVVLQLHNRVTTRSEFDETLATPRPVLPTDSLGGRIRVAYDSLEQDIFGSKVFAIGLQTAADRRSDRLATWQAGGGVYPLEVQLRNADDITISGFVTHVVVADVRTTTTDGQTAVASPPVLTQGQALDVAWVWPLIANPAYRADGTPDPAVVDELTPTGRLGKLASTIDALSDLPLTLVPSPETLEAWQALSRPLPELASGIAAVQRAGAFHEVVAGPYVPLDLPALATVGLDVAFDGEMVRGTNALDHSLGTPLNTRTALPGPVDQRTLQALRQRGIDRVVVEDATLLSPVDETPDRPYTVLSTPGDTSSEITAVATDSGFQRLFTGDQPPALRAAHLLAGLALTQEVAPSLNRGVVLVSPRRWSDSDAFIAALTSGLRNNPFLRPVTVDQLITDVPVAEGAPRTLQLRNAQAPPVTAAQFWTGYGNVQALRRLLGETNPAVVRSDRALPTVLSSAWQTNEGRARARSILDDGIAATINGLLARVAVAASTTVTVTSSRAEVPITIRNDTGLPLRVHLHFQSEKLLFPGGADRDVDLVAQNTTLRLPVETRSSGTFPVTVTVTTTDNPPLAIQTTQLRVRSTFVSGVGIFITAAAVLFLALWWGWDIRRRRRVKGAGGPRPVVTPASA